MRLIDADKILYFKGKDIVGEDAYITQKDVIDEMPTVDAEPIRHGHWNILTPQDDDGGWVAISCSNCNFVTPYASSRKEIEENGFVYHYCMYCGALMDEVEE